MVQAVAMMSCAEPAQGIFVTLLCDGCGRHQTCIPEDAEQVFAGWRIGEHGAQQDFCPGCVG